MKPGLSPPSARIFPHGFIIKEWPKHSPPPSILPTEHGDTTKEPFSIARALFKTCQCASPVFFVNAEGTKRISAPFFDNSRNRLGNLKS